jgi:hypothetical protein
VAATFAAETDVSTTIVLAVVSAAAIPQLLVRNRLATMREVETTRVTIAMPAGKPTDQSGVHRCGRVLLLSGQRESTSIRSDVDFDLDSYHVLALCPPLTSVTKASFCGFGSD